MAGELQTNDRGDVIRFDGQSWVPADIVVNDKTGQRMAFDGKAWVDIPGSAASSGPASDSASDRLKYALSTVGKSMLQGVGDVAYGPFGMAAKAADRVFGTDAGAAFDNLKTGAIKGVSGLASLPQTIIDAPSQIAGAINGRNVTPPSQALEKATGIPWLPNQSQVQGAITQAPTAIGLPPVNMRTAQSSGGRLLQDVGQAIGGAPLAPMMGYNLASGVGSWGAGELTDQNPWAKMAGALGGAGLYGAFQQTAPNAISMIRRRLDQYSPAELNAGEAIQREAQARGIQLFPNEAVDRSRAEPLSQLAGTAAVQPQGRPIQQMATARVMPGGSIPTAIEDTANTVAPRVTNPNETARALATAADKAVAEPMNARVAAANPLMAQAAPDLVDPQMKVTLLAQIDSAAASANPKGALAAHLKDLRSQVDVAETVGQMNEPLAAFRDMLKASPFEGGTVIKGVRSNMRPIIQSGISDLETTSPAFKAFREVYKGSGGQPSPFSVAVEQAQASPAARIAQAQTNPATEGALGAFGSWLKGGANVPVPDAAVVKSEIARLAKQDPEAARNAVRALIQRHADAAFAITKEGIPPPDSGVGFVKSLAGTDDTRKALIAAIEGVTGNQSTAKGFGRLLDIVERTGVTPNIGSPTAGRMGMMKEAGQGGAIGGALQGANLSRGSFIGTLQDWNEMARAGRSWGQIADLWTQPDSVAKLRQLAIMNPQSAKAQALAATILQGVNHAPPVKGTPR